MHVGSARPNTASQDVVWKRFMDIPPSARAVVGIFTFPVLPIVKMAELVLGALGVVPLIGFAIKSYKTLYHELKTFRHCSKGVRRGYRQLKTQRQLFENECLLLLRDCVRDDMVVEAMMVDPDHDGWRDDTQDGSLRELLKANYEVYAELVQDILETTQKLESRLACFQALKPKQQEVCHPSPSDPDSRGGVRELTSKKGGENESHLEASR